MKSASPGLLIMVYCWLFAIFITFASVRAIMEAREATSHHGHAHVLLLATVEIIAAILFAFRATRKGGGIVLLLVFGIAIVLTAVSGNVPANLLFYAVNVAFVLALERSLPGEWSLAS
jgi:uncharacterized membrane protein HdeD (DUF308 family)